LRKPNDLPTSHLIAYIILGIAVVIFNVYALEYALTVTFDQ